MSTRHPQFDKQSDKSHYILWYFSRADIRSALQDNKLLGDTHGPDVVGFGGGGATGAAGGMAVAAVSGAEGGAAASGGGISTCFQSCPSSTMRAMSVPRRTLRLPSSICK